MKHPSESVLGMLALQRDLVKNRESVEAHVAGCSLCRSAFEAIVAFDTALAEPDSWLDKETGNAGLEELRRFAARSAAEDQTATELLAEFEAPESAARFVWADLPARSAYRTGGVARRLCRIAYGMCEHQPLYALALAQAASRIATNLPDTSYPRRGIHELRGESWKEQANALRFLGRFPEALAALDQAEAEYRRLPHEGIGLVNVQYVRASLLMEQDRLEEAEALATASAGAALVLGDTERFMRGRHLLGHILFERHDYAAAAQVWDGILQYGRARGDQLWIAREELAIGNCHLELDQAAEAGRSLHEALRIFTELNIPSEITRTEWALARLEFREGHGVQAMHRLREAVSQLSACGMLTDSALAALDLAEMLDASGRMREIPRLLNGVVSTFTEAGKLSGALAALAYLKSAAATGTLTPAMLTHVRRFLVAADRQPELLFGPPL